MGGGWRWNYHFDNHLYIIMKLIYIFASACAALGGCCGTKCPLLMAFFSLSSVSLFSLLSPDVTFLPEGVILGFLNFADFYISIQLYISLRFFILEAKFATRSS
jgi:hypothetical protein